MPSSSSRSCGMARVLFLCILLVLVRTNPVISNTKPVTRVVIGGCGPAGLLTAHCLLSRPNRAYEVSIFESREDPRIEQAGPRAYSLGLNIRGQTAIKTFDNPTRSDGLWSAIFANGVESDSFFLHIGKLKLHIRKPAKKLDKNAPPPTLLIPRNRLVSAMLDVLLKTHGTARVKVSFNSKLSSVDLDKREVVLENGLRQSYDLIVGGDGVSSAVRSALLEEKEKSSGSSESVSFVAQEELLPGKYKVMVTDAPSELDPLAVHAMECTAKNRSGFSLFLIPAPHKKMCALLAWKGDNVPAVLQEGVPTHVLQDAIASDFPLFGRPSEEAIMQLGTQRPSEAKTIRCNRYHDVKGRALLLGDSAHSTGGTLGQGANSALMDVVALDKCLDECGDDLDAALPLYSSRQVVEGLSLWRLLQLPPKKLPWSLLYNAAQFLRGLLRKIFPFVGQPTQLALSTSLVPFSKIVDRNKFWLNLVLSEKDKLL